MEVYSAHLQIKLLSFASPSRRLDKNQQEGVKNGRSGAIKPDRLDLSCKANKCSDAGTGDLGVLTTHETSPWFSLGDAGSTRPG